MFFFIVLAQCHLQVLGVTMDANGDVSEQCGIAASEVNQVLKMITRTCRYHL